jgi:hypothetical protein
MLTTSATDTKTLLEHHYELRIEALRDDPRVNYAKRLVAVERLAMNLGWKHMCDKEFIAIHMQDICSA